MTVSTTSAPAVARRGAAVAQDGRALVVVPVVQHHLQQVEIRGGNRGEEIACRGGEPAGQAAPGGLLAGALGGVRQVEHLAVQPGVGCHQLQDKLPVRAADVHHSRHARGMDPAWISAKERREPATAVRSGRPRLVRPKRPSPS
jgi:hypothetical protein